MKVILRSKYISLASERPPVPEKSGMSSLQSPIYFSIDLGFRCTRRLVVERSAGNTPSRAASHSGHSPNFMSSVSGASPCTFQNALACGTDCPSIPP